MCWSHGLTIPGPAVVGKRHCRPLGGQAFVSVLSDLLGMRTRLMAQARNR